MFQWCLTVSCVFCPASGTSVCEGKCHQGRICRYWELKKRSWNKRRSGQGNKTSAQNQGNNDDDDDDGGGDDNDDDNNNNNIIIIMIIIIIIITIYNNNNNNVLGAQKGWILFWIWDGGWRTQPLKTWNRLPLPKTLGCRPARERHLLFLHLTMLNNNSNNNTNNNNNNKITPPLGLTPMNIAILLQWCWWLFWISCISEFCSLMQISVSNCSGGMLLTVDGGAGWAAGADGCAGKEAGDHQQGSRRPSW